MIMISARGISIAATLALLGATLPQAAADQGFFNEPAIIGGILLGGSELKSYSCTDCGSPVGDLDDSDTAWGAFVGYRPNRYVALLLGYIDLNETTASGRDDDWTDRLEADGFELKLRGSWPFSDYYFVYADLGVFLWDQNVTFGFGDGEETSTLSGSFDSTDMTFGFGVGYRLPVGENAVVFSAGWSRFQDVGTNDPELGHKNDIDLIGGNISYEFGLPAH